MISPSFPTAGNVVEFKPVNKIKSPSAKLVGILNSGKDVLNTKGEVISGEDEKGISTFIPIPPCRYCGKFVC